MNLETTMTWLLPPCIALLMLFLPQLSRANTFFAVTVSDAFAHSASARQLLQRYRLGVLASTLLALACIAPLWILLPRDAALVSANLIAPLLVVFGSLFAFIACRHEALQHSQASATVRSASLEPMPPVSQLIPGGWFWNLAPYGFVAASSIWLGMHWSSIPEQVVMQLQGDEVRTTAKSLASVFAVPLLMLATMLLTHACMLLARFIRRLPGYIERVRAINLLLLGVIWAIGIMGGYNALMVLYGAAWVSGSIGLSLNIASIVFILLWPLLLWWRGHFGPSSARSGQGDRTPDQCWKLGMFYYNPNDSALWVEKRFGIGYTVNFARPGAWIFIISVLAVSALIVVLSLNVQ